VDQSWAKRQWHKGGLAFESEGAREDLAAPFEASGEYENETYDFGGIEGLGLLFLDCADTEPVSAIRQALQNAPAVRPNLTQSPSCTPANSPS